MKNIKKRVEEVTTVSDINTDIATIGRKTKKEKEEIKNKKRMIINRLGQEVVRKNQKTVTRRI